MYQPSFKRQSGFTLVEIAIVLVIIGLLLGGVLKGTELIENSKVRKAVSDINGVSAAYNSYIDRYRRTPGDDGPLATLTARGGAWTNMVAAGAGNLNGALVSNLNNTFNGGNEHDNFWMQLRAAGFITGDVALTGAAALPQNPFGGRTGVTTAAVNGNLIGLKVCMGLVPGKSAQALDTQLDDGNGATGSMRATEGNANGTNTNPTNTALATPYTEDNTYTVCVKI